MSENERKLLSTIDKMLYEIKHSVINGGKPGSQVQGRVRNLFAIGLFTPPACLDLETYLYAIRYRI